MPMYRVKATTSTGTGLLPVERPETYYVAATRASAAQQRIERHYRETQPATRYRIDAVEDIDPWDVPSVMPVVHAGGGA